MGGVEAKLRAIAPYIAPCNSSLLLRASPWSIWWSAMACVRGGQGGEGVTTHHQNNPPDKIQQQAPSPHLPRRQRTAPQSVAQLHERAEPGAQDAALVRGPPRLHPQRVLPGPRHHHARKQGLGSPARMVRQPPHPHQISMVCPQMMGHPPKGGQQEAVPPSPPTVQPGNTSSLGGTSPPACSRWEGCNRWGGTPGGRAAKTRTVSSPPPEG